MPSETRRDDALKALAAPLERFHSALADAVEDVRAFLSSHREPGDGRIDEQRAELGPFASGRIDATRFSSLIAKRHSVDSSSVAGMERAYRVLSDVAQRGNAPFQGRVSPGARLHATVAAVLRQIGRAFGAARVAQLARSGKYDSTEHDNLLDGMPFASWTPAERGLAPPIVVEVDGEELHPGGLAEFLDGTVKILLLVRGASRPAPLARLITPHTFVAQALDVQGIARFARWPGPGVAAIVSDGAARFEHDPTGGAFPWERLTVEHRPEAPVGAAICGLSPAQQAEELSHLDALATAPPVVTIAAAAAPAAANAETATPDPVDQLASWLLNQAQEEAAS